MPNSMQVYAELRVLTNRPTQEEEAAAPHRLMASLAGDAYSAALWLADVAKVLAEAETLGQLPIIVGGTGLYFKALTEGLSDIPEIPPAIRERYRAAAQTEPAAGASRRASPPRSRDRRAAPAQRYATHRPRAGGVGSHGPSARRMAGQQTAAAAAACANLSHRPDAGARGAVPPLRCTPRRHDRARGLG